MLNRMSQLIPVYRIENIWQDKNSRKLRVRHRDIKQTAEEPALPAATAPKTNPPAGMNQRADRETYIALSQRLCAYCWSGSDRLHRHVRARAAPVALTGSTAQCAHLNRVVLARRQPVELDVL